MSTRRFHRGRSSHGCESWTQPLYLTPGRIRLIPRIAWALSAALGRCTCETWTNWGVGSGIGLHWSHPQTQNRRRQASVLGLHAIWYVKSRIKVMLGLTAGAMETAVHSESCSSSG